MLLSPRYITFFVLAIVAVLVASYRINMNQDLQVTKSVNDSREYRSLTLANGLKVVLVSDKDADKAAASLAVNTGSGDDPENREGLAHFLEHMLFLGTEPYPEAGAYQAFITQHGGSYNAFTAHDVTNYFFELDNDYLESALDRFAPFFISPTLDAQYVERETNAVNAEYTSKSQDDGRRVYSAEKQAMNPEHPYSKFATGSLTTLADRPERTVREDLLAFYEKFYTASEMTLAVVGNYSLDQLEQWVRADFSDIPARPGPERAQRPDLFVADQLPLDLQIMPVKELRQLKLTFPTPESLSAFRYKPLQFFSHLLGHEGEGSLLALLKERGWAEGLSAGRSVNTPWESALTVQIQLTLVGMHRIDEITEAVFAYIDLIKKDVKNKEFIEQAYAEQRNLSELAFRYQEKSRPSHFVVRVANNLRHVSPGLVLYGDYLWETPTSAQLEHYLSYLRPDNMLRTLIAPEVETNTQDIWYDTQLMLRPAILTDNRLKPEYRDQLHLPEANPFVPEQFDLTQSEARDVPSLISDKEGMRVWYYPEHEFLQPKARVILSLQTPSVATEARDRIIAQLFSHTVNEALSSYSYPAYIAGLNYQLSAGARGLELAIGGYHDKLNVLLDRIVDTMKSVELTEEEFGRYHAQLKRQLENRLKAKPYERTINTLRVWIRKPGFDEAELLAALETITREDVLNFRNTLGNNLHADMFVHGTLSEEAAMNIAGVIRNAFTPSAGVVPLPAIHEVPAGNWQHPIAGDHPDAAITMYVQGQQFRDSTGITSDASRARYALLAQILKSPYPNWLRTDKKLGYAVFSASFPQQSVPGIAFIVQSPVGSPAALVAESDAFFASFSNTLNEMTEEEFATQQEGLISLLVSRKKNMTEKAGQFWSDIDSDRMSFDTNKAIAAEVEKVTLDEIRTLFRESIIERKDPRLLMQYPGSFKDKKDALNPEEWNELSRIEDDNLPTVSRSVK